MSSIRSFTGASRTALVVCLVSAAVLGSGCGGGSGSPAEQEPPAPLTPEQAAERLLRVGSEMTTAVWAVATLGRQNETVIFWRCGSGGVSYTLNDLPAFETQAVPLGTNVISSKFTKCKLGPDLTIDGRHTVAYDWPSLHFRGQYTSTAEMLRIQNIGWDVTVNGTTRMDSQLDVSGTSVTERTQPVAGFTVQSNPTGNVATFVSGESVSSFSVDGPGGSNRYEAFTYTLGGSTVVLSGGVEVKEDKTAVSDWEIKVDGAVVARSSDGITWVVTGTVPTF